MARVMLVGYGPLPKPGLNYIEAAALRTNQFVDVLVQAGHTVNLFTLPLPGDPSRPSQGIPQMVPETCRRLAYQHFSVHSGEFAIRTLNQQVDQLKPDALLAVNTYPAYLAAKLNTDTPLWTDLYDAWMIERQARAFVSDDDAPLAPGWAVLRTVLRRLDRYSVPTRPQLHAILGLFMSIGRMNRYTYQYVFPAHIPVAGFVWPEPSATEENARIEPILRGPVVPSEAFILLWSGGFKPWHDIETTVACAELLMHRYPQVHFVSTGGPAPQVDHHTYRMFEDRLARSPWKDRFHRMGWLDSSTLSQIYREANVGLNIDGKNYSTMFGAPYRMATMAASGLPMAGTIGTELSEWLEEERAIMGAEPRHPEQLAGVIEPWIEQREHLNVYARNAQHLMNETLTPRKTVAPVLKWLEHPSAAPDNRTRRKELGTPGENPAHVALNDLDQTALMLEQYTQEEVAGAFEQLERQRSGPKRRGLLGFRKSERHEST